VKKWLNITYKKLGKVSSARTKQEVLSKEWHKYMTNRKDFKRETKSCKGKNT